MQCGSCTEEIPEDSIFCPECGSRQEMSRAGGLPGVGGVGLGGQDVSGGRNFGVVSGEAVMNQNVGIPGQGLPPGAMPNIMGQIVPGMQPQQTPPGMPLQGAPPTNIGDSNLPPLTGGMNPSQVIDNDPNLSGGMSISNNPSLSPTDAMVNRIAEAERAVKNERRSQWLQMQESAANVLTSIGGELPSHLRGNEGNTAEFLANAIGTGKDDSGNDALYRRMSEVAIRRVARKRGVAVETPQIKSEGGILTINVTYADDGRVLDTPDDLSQAFEHAITTEIALKGLDLVVEMNLFRSKDGAIEQVVGSSSGFLPTTSEPQEEMFACEVCDGLVKESDNECPHCGAMFEDDEASSPPPSRSGPPGPGRGGPPGPSRGGPPGPSRGGPPGPKRGGPPSGPKKESPSGGGPPKRSGPPSGGPGGGPPKKGGPPGGGGPPKRGGPPGSGGPPKRGGPPGSGGPPKKGGPPSGGPGGGPPKRGGPPSGPKRGPPK
ncbi:MAG: zinc ribbon domain-containing protein [Candidatus Poseidoniaceae archaeon]|nr:zinc ribbon domain-containing protein [Candidatus Poseidoniaceae archaeon]